MGMDGKASSTRGPAVNNLEHTHGSSRKSCAWHGIYPQGSLQEAKQYGKVCVPDGQAAQALTSLVT